MSTASATGAGKAAFVGVEALPGNGGYGVDLGEEPAAGAYPGWGAAGGEAAFFMIAGGACTFFVAGCGGGCGAALRDAELTPGAAASKVFAKAARSSLSSIASSCSHKSMYDGLPSSMVRICSGLSERPGLFVPKYADAALARCAFCSEGHIVLPVGRVGPAWGGLVGVA
jgi:hypothetical protein